LPELIVENSTFNILQGRRGKHGHKTIHAPHTHLGPVWENNLFEVYNTNAYNDKYLCVRYFYENNLFAV
jgi:hypothetical protein